MAKIYDVKDLVLVIGDKEYPLGEGCAEVFEVALKPKAPDAMWSFYLDMVWGAAQEYAFELACSGLVRRDSVWLDTSANGMPILKVTYLSPVNFVNIVGTISV